MVGGSPVQFAGLPVGQCLDLIGSVCAVLASPLPPQGKLDSSACEVQSLVNQLAQRQG